MADCLQKEGVVPAGAFDFASYRGLKWKRLQDIERQLSHEGKILWRMVLSRPITILGEMNIEHPMQLVLDTPMALGYPQKFFWRHVFRQNIVADEGCIGTLPSQTSARCDAPDSCDTGKAVEFGQPGIADDRCPSGLASIPNRGRRWQRFAGSPKATACSRSRCRPAGPSRASPSDDTAFGNRGARPRIGA